MPRQGKKAPWQVLNDYVADRPALRKASFNDGILRFSKANATS
jgi:cyclohexanone monooxygenase